MPPQLPSRYTVGHELGRGGMGIVYEADDVRLERKVAVKVLHGGPDSPGSDVRQRRFAQEARAASALNHPNIITIHDIDSHDGLDFIVMEIVDGVPLTRTGRQDGPMPIDRAVDYAIQIASALAASHAAGIVHRDVKPANIMVTGEGRIKVLDFGLSKKTVADAGAGDSPTETVVAHTAAGAVVGTGGYMSPEQARGEPVDARSDVFSFGVVLYELLAGERAFAGDSYWTVMNAVVRESPRPIQQSRADVPPALARIVERCLEKNRAARYPSAVELLEDLRRLAPTGAPTASPLGRRMMVRAVSAAAAAALVAATVAGWLLVRRSQNATLVERSLPEIEQLVAVGKFVDAYKTAIRARRAAPDDERVTRALLGATQPLSMREPDGADVFFKDYVDADGPWLPLGRVPLDGVRVPVGQLRWRLVKAGFDPVEGGSAIGPMVTLGAGGDAPPGMVYARGGRVTFATTTALLPDFWIDKYEVTNREFKQFVDAGGYREPRYWKEPVTVNGIRMPIDDIATRFTDRTGRPGPATWELGSFADGQADHPVGGLSWYEAAAYAEFVHKKLPTAYHWRQATGNVLFGQVVAAMGNFNGKSPQPVTALKDLGTYGTYGLAGNVKEWIWNAAGESRQLVGGAWGDPPYMARNRELRPALDRNPANGLRCIRDVAALPLEALLPMPPPGTRARSDRPASDAVFASYKPLFSYDHTPLDARIESGRQADFWRGEHVSIAAAYGRERVPVDIYLPAAAAPPYQAVVWFPGGYAFGLYPSSRDLDAVPGAPVFSFIVRSGRALVVPTFQGTFERFTGIGDGPGQDQMNAYRDMVTQWSKDLGRTIDYLETRPDIDATRVGYYGLSAAADAALPVVALEPRLKAIVLVSGGLPAIRRPPEVDPLNFAGHITAPTLLVSGREDFIFPLESVARPLFELLGAPPDRKRFVIHDHGHLPVLNDLIREVLGWFDQYLGPPRPAPK